MKLRNCNGKAYPHLLMITLLLSSCSFNYEPNSILNDYDESVISYFKEVALGFENGGTEITRKWQSNMYIFIDGDVNNRLINKLELIINEINSLATDGFKIELTEDPKFANNYIFFGRASDFNSLFSGDPDLIWSSFGQYSVWHNNNIIYKARIFIDTHRSTLDQQKSLIVEELTQSLGLGKDSPRYPTSVFYETRLDGGFAQNYSEIDKDLIRLLYHPKMQVGLNSYMVDELLREILIENSGNNHLHFRQ